MRFKQIIENSTTAGSVATVAQTMMTQTRESVDVKGLKPVKQVMQGTKKKGPYANSINEGKVKELAQDLKNLTSHQFQEKYKQSKAEIRADMKKVNEDDLSEQDLIVIPGQGRLRGTGFTKHDPDRAEHEGQTLKNSLHTIIRLATHLDKELTVRDNFPEWVSEKVGSIKGDMLSVMNYIISSQEMRHDSDAMEGSENKYSNLSNRGVNRGINRAGDDFNRMMDLDQAESPHYKTQHQQDTKQRLKTKPLAGPKGVLPEGSQRVDSIVTDALKRMKGPEVSDAVVALKRVLGDRAYNERRGFYSFYVDQIHDMYGQQGVAEAGGFVDTVKQGVNKLTSIKVKVSPYDQVWIPGTTVGYYTPGGSNSRESQKVNLEKLSAELKKQGINTSDIQYTDGANNERFTGDKYPAAWFIKVVKGKAQTVLDMLKNNKIPGYTAALPELSYPSGKPPSYSHSQDGLGVNPKESLEQGVAETQGVIRADLPKDQGRYTNDTTPNIGSVSMNRIKVGDIVNYFGEKVEVLELGNGQARVTGGGKTMNVPLSNLKQYGQGMREGKIDFAKKLQKNVDKHNKAVVKTKQAVGSRIVDIGAGGKEHNEKTDAAWDAAKKKVAEGYKKK